MTFRKEAEILHRRKLNQEGLVESPTQAGRGGEGGEGRGGAGWWVRAGMGLGGAGRADMGTHLHGTVRMSRRAEADVYL